MTTRADCTWCVPTTSGVSLFVNLTVCWLSATSRVEAHGPGGHTWRLRPAVNEWPASGLVLFRDHRAEVSETGHPCAALRGFESGYADAARPGCGSRRARRPGNACDSRPTFPAPLRAACHPPRACSCLAIRLRSAGGLTRLGTRSRESLPATNRSPCHTPRESCINLPACMSGAPWILFYELCAYISRGVHWKVYSRHVLHISRREGIPFLTGIRNGVRISWRTGMPDDLQRSGFSEL